MTKSFLWNLAAGLFAVLLTLVCIGRLMLSEFVRYGYRDFDTGIAGPLTLLVLVLHVGFVGRLLLKRRGFLALAVAAGCALLYLLGDYFFSSIGKIGG
ncbi:hypothetical protein CDA63_19975 [Hymenobacter amundsenii]|uniref:Uncharacterized protein n=1 Tax=Hymenobacter amundsenii TaxID=2006685 RepID=A0A246FFR3_9BACT|nr:hypothetical protein [Hymenobacter amundsenii]OWP61337.1 hypothetical protein CDA63_19975 [Hymenobacter amundsenii]